MKSSRKNGKSNRIELNSKIRESPSLMVNHIIFSQLSDILQSFPRRGLVDFLSFVCLFVCLALILCWKTCPSVITTSDRTKLLLLCHSFKPSLRQGSQEKSIIFAYTQMLTRVETPLFTHICPVPLQYWDRTRSVQVWTSSGQIWNEENMDQTKKI